MAKNVAKQTKTPAAPKGKATPAPATRTRAAAYTPSSVISIVTGEGQRRVVKGLACERALLAMVDGKGKARTVADYLSAFAPECEKKPMPGRAGQPGTVQASAMLRFLEREGAVTVK